MKKTLISLLALIFIAVIASCQSDMNLNNDLNNMLEPNENTHNAQQLSFEEAEINQNSHIIMTTKYAQYTTDASSVALTIINGTDDAFVFGKDLYVLQALINGEWINAPSEYDSQRISWSNVRVKEQSYGVVTANLAHWYPLVPGQYRILLPIGSSFQTIGEEILAAEFTITPNS